jgi:hypothetical protein
LCDEGGKLLASGEKKFPELSDVQTVSVEVGNQPAATTLKLHLTLLRPTGEIAAEKSLDWHSAGQSASAVEGTVPAQ